MADKGKEFIGAYADPATARALAEIARREFDGNSSMALRRAVREAAERRGVSLADSSARRDEARTKEGRA